ncbi:uncharacterized protein LOC143697081 [Siphateles boraxobius]|uniref:uncharacterized protein LOC143697081 n=1 Tax=Siphateles boraxobius TaxID=180520 RepID=UPI004063D398
MMYSQLPFATRQTRQLSVLCAQMHFILTSLRSMQPVADYELQMMMTMSKVIQSVPFKVLRTSLIGSVVKLMRQTHFPSVCRELISTTEACNRGNGRRRLHPNVDLMSHSLPRQALILVPLPKNSSQKCW